MSIGTRVDTVNLWSREDTLRYARSLHTSYGLIVVHNGIKYQVKHILAEEIIRRMGWEIVAVIPGRKQ